MTMLTVRMNSLKALGIKSQFYSLQRWIMETITQNITDTHANIHIYFE